MATYQDRMRARLEETFQPLVLEISDDSARHAGHLPSGDGHAPSDGGGETHFSVLLVSAAFEGKSRVERQRMVYDCLQAELKERVHALALKTQTPAEAGQGKTRAGGIV